MVITADKGYYNITDIKKCIDNGITPYLSTPKSNDPQEKKGFYSKNDFTYDEKSDCYFCPNNQKLLKASYTQKKRGRVNKIYQGTLAMCKACPL